MYCSEIEGDLHLDLGDLRSHVPGDKMINVRVPSFSHHKEEVVQTIIDSSLGRHLADIGSAADERDIYHAGNIRGSGLNHIHVGKHLEQSGQANAGAESATPEIYLESIGPQSIGANVEHAIVTPGILTGSDIQLDDGFLGAKIRNAINFGNSAYPDYGAEFPLVLKHGSHNNFAETHSADGYNGREELATSLSHVPHDHPRFHEKFIIDSTPHVYSQHQGPNQNPRQPKNLKHNQISNGGHLSGGLDHHDSSSIPYVPESVKAGEHVGGLINAHLSQSEGNYDHDDGIFVTHHGASDQPEAELPIYTSAMTDEHITSGIDIDDYNYGAGVSDYDDSKPIIGGANPIYKDHHTYINGPPLFYGNDNYDSDHTPVYHQGSHDYRAHDETSNNSGKDFDDINHKAINHYHDSVDTEIITDYPYYGQDYPYYDSSSGSGNTGHGNHASDVEHFVGVGVPYHESDEHFVGVGVPHHESDVEHFVGVGEPDHQNQYKYYTADTGIIEPCGTDYKECSGTNLETDDGYYANKQNNVPGRTHDENNKSNYPSSQHTKYYPTEHESTTSAYYRDGKDVHYAPGYATEEINPEHSNDDFQSGYKNSFVAEDDHHDGGHIYFIDDENQYDSENHKPSENESYGPDLDYPPDNNSNDEPSITKPEYDNDHHIPNFRPSFPPPLKPSLRDPFALSPINKPFGYGVSDYLLPSKFKTQNLYSTLRSKFPAKQYSNKFITEAKHLESVYDKSPENKNYNNYRHSSHKKPFTPSPLLYIGDSPYDPKNSYSSQISVGQPVTYWIPSSHDLSIIRNKHDRDSYGSGSNTDYVFVGVHPSVQGIDKSHKTVEELPLPQVQRFGNLPTSISEGIQPKILHFGGSNFPSKSIHIRGNTGHIINIGTINHGSGAVFRNDGSRPNIHLDHRDNVKEKTALTFGNNSANVGNKARTNFAQRNGNIKKNEKSINIHSAGSTSLGNAIQNSKQTSVTRKTSDGSSSSRAAVQDSLQSGLPLQGFEALGARPSVATDVGRKWFSQAG